MKQMKTVLSLLLSVFLLVGMLAGCGSEEAPAATEPNKDAGGQTPVTQPSELGEIDEKQKLQVLPDRAGGDKESKEHTIMVYMVGSDLETNYGAASLDLVEMMESGLNTEKANLVVYAGGAQRWKLGLPSDVNSVLTLTPAGTDFEFYGTTQAAINTGDPNALVDFLDLCAAEFPAENYSLIFWDHGGGAVSGFGYCESLTDLQLPESLEFIGQGAFGTDIGMPKSDTTKVITIGKNVSCIGSDAFSCFNLTEYVVDPDNEHYSSMDGCLLNVGGTALISVPYATEGTFEVPYGVCYLAGRSLQDCNGITEMILPDTVAAIDLEAGVPSGLQKLTVGVGLIVWGNVADYSLVSDITISEENPKYTVTGGQISEKP